MSTVLKELIRNMVREEKFKSVDDVLTTLKEMFRNV